MTEQKSEHTSKSKINSNNNTTNIANKNKFHNKNLEQVDYLLKVADKNKRQLQESYGKQLDKIENKIKKNEVILSQILQEINEKEFHIYEVQKIKVEGFKNETIKFKQVSDLISSKILATENLIKATIKSNKSYDNQSKMLYEDYLSKCQEELLVKDKLNELKETMKHIEKTYPKDFEFLTEDIKLEKELAEIKSLQNEIKMEIKQLENQKKELNINRADIEERKDLVEVEFRKIDEQIEESYKDDHLKIMENYLVTNISDLLVFNNLRGILQEYYERKKFDIENEINVLTMKNLAEKLVEMKNEFYQTKNDKIMEQQKIVQEINDLKNLLSNPNQNMKANKNKMTTKEINEKIKQKNEEGEKLHEEIRKLELNCKKKETLFNKYLILLRNKCVKGEDESYFTNNPCLILENHFEEELKHEMIAALSREKNFLTKEDLLKYEGTIDIYFRDLVERERTCQLILLQRTKIENNLNNYQTQINNNIDQVQEVEKQIKLKNMRLSEINKNLKTLQEKIQARNRTLKFNLENLSETNYMDYLNANGEVLNKMKKIYGNKILSKVFQSQKEKFYENVMLDHLFKKSKINEFTIQLKMYEKTLSDFEDEKEKLLNDYQNYCVQIDEFKNLIKIKNEELENLRVSKENILKNVEQMLIEEKEDIYNEKIKLRTKLNCDFYFVKVKEIANKIETLNVEKNRILNEFFKFRDIIIEREKKLYNKDAEYNNEQISNSMIKTNELDNKFNSPIGNTINPKITSMDTFPTKTPPYTLTNKLGSIGSLEYNKTIVENNEKFIPYENDDLKAYSDNDQQQEKEYSNSKDEESYNDDQEDIDDVEINNSKFKTEDSQQTNLKSQVTSKIKF